MYRFNCRVWLRCVLNERAYGVGGQLKQQHEEEPFVNKTASALKVIN